MRMDLKAFKFAPEFENFDKRPDETIAKSITFQGSFKYEFFSK